MNYWIFGIAALIPTITGFIWYNPKVFGNAWMKAAEMTEEKVKGTNMGLVMGLSIFLSFLLAMQIMGITVHQSHIYSIFADFAEGSPELVDMEAFLEKYGTLYRTFKHGVFHGVLSSIFFVLPVMGTNALFERKSGKYILINWGYWAVTLGLMGGVICQWL